MDEIERFITVVEEGSFTKASKKLFITQPALSLSIRRLEQMLGKKLFKRIGKRFILTTDGENIYNLGLQILKYWQKAKDRDFSNAPLSLSIGIFDNAALRLSKYFQEKFTENRQLFEITIHRSAALNKGMRNGIYDICISVLDSSANVDSNYFLIKKFSEKLYPVSGKKWKLGIAKIPFILYNRESETRQYIDSAFLRQGIRPNIIVESTSPAFMKELAIGGCGVALLPKNFIESELALKKLQIQKLPLSFKREFGLFLNKESNLKPADQIIKDIIKKLKAE